jgi:hypothetical protein
VIVAPTNLEEALEVIQALLAKVADLERRLEAAEARAEKAEARAEKAEARAEKAEARIVELEADNAALRQKLAMYEGKKTPPRDPSTPSGAVPPYEKPGSGNTKKGGKGKKKRKKSGRKKGHAGARREKPACVDEHKHHSLGTSIIPSTVVPIAAVRSSKTVRPAHVTPKTSPR